MLASKRSRGRILTAEGLKKLQEGRRSHETEENFGSKYTLERLGELTGLDPETVRNVLDGKGCDKKSIARCFETFGLTLAESDHVSATQATAAKPDPNFVGREGAIADLDGLVAEDARVIVIQARGGVGKTTLARKYLTQTFGSFLEFPIAKETKDIALIENLLEEKLRQLGEEPGREFLVSLDRLKRKLQTEAIGILIDNLEPALDSGGKLIAAHRGYVELLRVLADPTVKSLTLITTRERLREPAVTVCHYALKTLDVSAWQAFFRSRNLPTETPALAALHHAYGGNAKAMDIVAGAVREDCAGDVAAYWQANQADLLVERDLEDLVTQQFDRLLRLDSDAYHLLCRMGCYRYQDVPTVTIEGLFCLLWDVPENRQRRVIKSLQDRSLVDCENGEFWLHPVVREEAISQLRKAKDWEMANREAAEFWSASIKIVETTKDAIKAFESYHHYIEINDFEQAAGVILKRRENERAGIGSLGRTFYRLGLLQQMTSGINQVIPHVEYQHSLSKPYNVVGDLYWLSGNVHEAISCHIESGKIADFLLKELEKNIFDLTSRSELEELRFSYLLNMSLCKIDLGELEEAEILLKDLLSESIKYPKSQMSAYFCLAFVNSCLGFEKASLEFAQKVQQFQLVKLGSWTRSYAMLFLGATYKNLGDMKKSLEMYHEVIVYAEEIHYRQAKAKAICGISELHRNQNEFDQALSKQVEAIEILKDIGAKCDLAEAHYQLALTYQAMGKTEESYRNFQEAIRLFTEMEAPKQVERVRKSMQNSN